MKAFLNSLKRHFHDFTIVLAVLSIAAYIGIGTRFFQLMFEENRFFAALASLWAMVSLVYLVVAYVLVRLRFFPWCFVYREDVR